MSRKLLAVLNIFFFITSVVAQQGSFEKRLIQQLDSYTRGQLAPAILADLEKLAFDEVPLIALQPQSTPPLLKRYPGLLQTIPYLSLGTYPTPLKQCRAMQALMGVNIVIKEDGQAGPVVQGHKLFSGNKVRKLEFLLADAKAHGVTRVITRGGTGSNHALATTIYAKSLGMDSTCLLFHQPNSHSVRRNLLLQQHYGAKLRINTSRALHYIALADEFASHKEKTGRFPYLIPTGGSCDRGAIGFVNAAYELKEQIEQGLMDEPAFIFVAVGVNSGGTTAGLLLGLRATGLKSRLVAVGVEPEDEFGQLEEQTKKLFRETNDLLTESDYTFPRFDFPAEQLMVLRGFGGEDYGLYTQEGMQAKELLEKTEQIKLDGTYTAKAFAAMLDYLKKGGCAGKTVLFWNTYCGEDFTDITSKVDYKLLPEAVHRYFEHEVQVLDRRL